MAGGYGAGSLWGYKYTPMNNSFYIWTFVYDVSDLASVTLYVREDSDGVNPLDDFANEVYEPTKFGYKGVSQWTATPMVRRVFPKGNVYNESVDLTCNSRSELQRWVPPMHSVLCTHSCRAHCVAVVCGFVFVSGQPCLPTIIADEYFLQVKGYSDVLLDYYIEAVDSKGNSKKTDIHVLCALKRHVIFTHLSWAVHNALPPLVIHPFLPPLRLSPLSFGLASPYWTKQLGAWPVVWGWHRCEHLEPPLFCLLLWCHTRAPP